MLHICIPECSFGQDDYAPNLPLVQKYHVYINGVFHCNLRYSQLLRLHEHLCEQSLSESYWPKFPPKKLLKLNEKQTAERIQHLEKYLQAVCETATGNLCLNGVLLQFFHAAQQATLKADCEPRSLDVFTLDGTRITLSVDATDNAQAVLNKLAQAIGLRHSNVSLFGLFLVRKGQKKLYSIVKWLRDFESPLLTLQRANETEKVLHKIVVRKGIVDPFLENEKVFMDTAAVKLLFTELRKSAQLQEYIKLCQSQPFYGHIHFDLCTTDYPRKNTEIELSFGHNVLLFRSLSDTLSSHSQSSTSVRCTENVFKLTRIRCWKLVRTGEPLPTFHLSFEYLMAKDHMEWISIYSHQAVLISLCLHVAVRALVKSMSNNYASTRFSSPELQNTNSTTATSPKLKPALAKKNGCSRNHVYESLRDIRLRRDQDSRVQEQSATNEAFATITDDDL